jgi:hypothetical protein
VPTSILEVFQQDPFFVYTLVAALFLGLVSLVTGWLRLDFLVLFQPKGLFQIALAVIWAIFLTLLSQTLPAPFTVNAADSDTSTSLSILYGLGRLPLYVIALAYGPTAGLVAAGLFAAFAATSGTLGWSEAVLALELTVLGWFAIAPSPRTSRWAGPLNVLLAYFLAWATGGSAFLQHLTGQAMKLSTHWAYHQATLLGVVVSMLLLFLISPKLYRTLFTGSRISPPVKPGVVEVVPPKIVLNAELLLTTELLERQRLRERGKLTEFPVDVQNQELKRKR